MRKLFLAAIFCSLFCCPNVSAVEPKSNLAEADASFTYKGKPIHPGLVQEFSSWISDPGLPTTITVDISAPHRNEYSADVTVDGKSICMDTEDGDGKKDGGYFCYEHLGKLANGLHVLKTSASGGGSGVFQDLFFVKFAKGEGYAEEGKKYKRLLMSIVRQYTFREGDDGKIKVLPDKVVIGNSQNRDKPTTLTF